MNVADQSRAGEAVRRVAVVGPTASGKSAVALAAALELSQSHGPLVDLVSVDSMQVYRGMDIGTAKPTRGEQASARHWLIDLVAATEDFTVSMFQDAYRAAIDTIRLDGRSAILVGGTGLYHRAVIDGLNLPGEFPQIRAAIENEAARVGSPEMHRRLAEIDPAAAARMEPSNTRRVVRALEVCEGSGRRFSTFGPGLDAYPPSDVTQIGLRWERAILADRISARVHQMMDAGFLDEVRELAERGLSRTAAQALGYRELLAFLGGRSTLDEAVETIIVRTRQFAVRQDRWFRRDPRIQWIDVSSNPIAQAVPAVVAALRQPPPTP